MGKLPSYITGIIIWLFIIYLTYRHYAVPIRKYKKDTKITCKREEKSKNKQWQKLLLNMLIKVNLMLISLKLTLVLLIKVIIWHMNPEDITKKCY